MYRVLGDRKTLRPSQECAKNPAFALPVGLQLAASFANVSTMNKISRLTTKNVGP
jgi:hypothetical protein